LLGAAINVCEAVAATVGNRLTLTFASCTLVADATDVAVIAGHRVIRVDTAIGELAYVVRALVSIVALIVLDRVNNLVVDLVAGVNGALNTVRQFERRLLAAHGRHAGFLTIAILAIVTLGVLRNVEDFVIGLVTKILGAGHAVLNTEATGQTPCGRRTGFRTVAELAIITIAIARRMHYFVLLLITIVIGASKAIIHRRDRSVLTKARDRIAVLNTVAVLAIGTILVGADTKLVNATVVDRARLAVIAAAAIVNRLVLARVGLRREWHATLRLTRRVAQRIAAGKRGRCDLAHAIHRLRIGAQRAGSNIIIIRRNDCIHLVVRT
jgi:hypothetical protein